MSRKEQITRYAHLVMGAYAGHEGLKTFYKIKDVKVQHFKDNAPSYFQWLLSAVPTGYQAEVNKRIQELRKELKTDASELVEKTKVNVTREDGELANFGNGDKILGRELWDEQGLGPTRENET